MTIYLNTFQQEIQELENLACYINLQKKNLILNQSQLQELNLVLKLQILMIKLLDFKFGIQRDKKIIDQSQDLIIRILYVQ